MKYTIILFFILFKNTFSHCQSVIISPGDTQAGIISNSTNNGIVPPRMNYTQILSIASPVEGTFVYDTEFKCLRFYNGSKWICLNDKLPAPNEVQGNFIGMEYGNTIPNTLYGYTYAGYPVSLKTDSEGNIWIFYINTFVDGYRPSGQNNTWKLKIQKFNSNFENLWTKELGTLYKDDIQYAKFEFSLDSQNNVYLTGRDYGRFIFGDGSSSNQGMFIVKYNSDGVFQFNKLTSGGACNGNDVKIDANGDIYVVGEYTGTVTFQDSPLSSLTSVSASKDGFIAKYNSIGDIVWVVSVGGNDNDYATKLEIAGTDLIIGGYFSNTASFGNSISKTSFGATDIFILKLSTSGSIAWVNTLGGTGLENLADINLRSDGQIDLFGDINGTLNYFANASTTTNQSVGVSSLSDLFLVKYFSNGNIYYGTPLLFGGPNSDVATSMVMNSSGDLYLTGSVGENFTFGGKTLLAGGFILKYGSVEKWAVSGPQQNGVDICVNSNNQVFVTGKMFNTKNYFIGNYLQPTTDKCYLWKYSE
ncbi:MAG: hypothetical protein CFE22_15215 [Cytophagaceae bacterium BCCC1]|nr:MAG: hypothetical protein CFE22_15215 [Cytophagaceae bacterium BCCC1]